MNDYSSYKTAVIGITKIMLTVYLEEYLIC